VERGVLVTGECHFAKSNHGQEEVLSNKRELVLWYAQCVDVL
jgi:hypothetical protein